MIIDLQITTKQYLTMQEFADTIGVARRSLYNWMRDGRLATVKIYGSRRVTIAEACRVAQVDRRFDQVALSAAVDVPSAAADTHTNSTCQSEKSPTTHH